MRAPYPRHREHLSAFVEERRRSHPHTVRQPGLLRSRLGDDRFFRLLDERRLWIEENCKCPFWVDSLIEGGFHEAVWFRYMF